MQRIHHTNLKEIILSSKSYGIQKVDRKPIGLWYDIDFSWTDWCKENTDWSYGNHFELEIEMNKILLIDTEDKFKSFLKQFGAVPYYAKEFSSSPSPEIKKMGLNIRKEHIDWKKVCSLYSGIEINPYDCYYNYVFSFINSWDVASGCIWNLNAIKTITKIPSKIYEKV